MTDVLKTGFFIENDNTKFVTPEAYISFPYLVKTNNDGKYQCAFLFDKNIVKIDLANIHVAPLSKERKVDLNASIIVQAYQNALIKAQNDGKTVTKFHRKPFRDGDVQKVSAGDAGFDLEKYPENRGKFVINASNNRVAPVLRTVDGQPTQNMEHFYPGAIVRAVLRAYYYSSRVDEKGNKIPDGVSFSLLGVQKVRDSEPFTLVDNVDDVFTALDTTSDNAASLGL
jgi:Protein of unknown function (DUF2815)